MLYYDDLLSNLYLSKHAYNDISIQVGSSFRIKKSSGNKTRGCDYLA